MRGRPYRVWAGSVLSPRDRFLPGLGARLADHERIASSVLRLLSAPQSGRVRELLSENVSRPLVHRMNATVEVRVPPDLRMLVDTADIVGRSLATRRVWEPHVTEVIRGLLSPGDVFVDVGAFVGYYTLLASRIVGAGGRVYAFEPYPKTYQRLVDNVQRNGATNVRAVAAAVGSEPGRVGIGFAVGGLPNVSLLTPREEGGVVPVAPLADLVDARDLERIRLVKVDVEGYEDRVLTGMAPLFERDLIPAIVVEVHGHLNPGVAGFVSDFCSESSFVPHLIVEGSHRRAAGAVPNYVPITQDWFASTTRDHFELLLLRGHGGDR